LPVVALVSEPAIHNNESKSEGAEKESVAEVAEGVGEEKEFEEVEPASVGVEL
jgi:hypothetical protein